MGCGLTGSVGGSTVDSSGGCALWVCAELSGADALWDCAKLLGTADLWVCAEVSLEADFELPGELLCWAGILPLSVPDG